MKKLFLFLAVALPCFIFTACSKEEGDGLSTNSQAPKGVVAVDLGLSVKWANMNVGATAPEEYGYYFAWGETQPYNDETYKFCNASGELTKYCLHSTDGIVDGKKVLEPVDDAAIVNWGKKWRMPTYDELEELCDNCTWTWTHRMGVEGCKVTGPNGNSIFLPAGGNKGVMYVDQGECEYWCTSLCLADGEDKYGCCLRYGKNDRPRISDGSRRRGRSVRPVCQ